MTTTLRWGLLGCGSIAGKFAEGLRTAEHARVVACGSRDVAKAAAFGARFGLAAERCHGTYDGLLDDPGVDAIYVALPHPLHAAWTIRAVQAGRHVLCEKPAGMNPYEAMVMADEARAHDRFLMEGFLYRTHPQTARLLEVIRSRAIGDIVHVEAAFAFEAPDDPNGRLFDPALGGGGILDVGCYPVSMARLLAGVAQGRPFLDPERVEGVGRLHPRTCVDVVAAGTLLFPGGMTASMLCGTRLAHDNTLRIHGTAGRITVPFPWIVARWGGRWAFTVERRGAAPEEVGGETPKSMYAHEADHVAAHLAARSSPALPWEDTLGNLAVLGRWRREAGVRYASERTTHTAPPLAGRPLRPGSRGSIPELAVPGLDRPVSRLIQGVADVNLPREVAVLFDRYVEQGGHTFDTAFHYGEHRAVWLGEWIRARGLADTVRIVTKGGHTPYCRPEYIRTQLEEVLRWLGARRVDVYFLHRDNPDVPAGEFVDALDELARAGWIGVYGGSNWTPERLDEANAHAAAHGRLPFRAFSNQFSLARMAQPMWGGCVGAADPATRAWIARTGLPLFAWSAQGRGFFTERGDPARRDDPELVRSFHTEDNFRRRERAFALAARLGVAPTTVALAWVLRQPLPILATIGPRSLAEIDAAVAAASLPLTPRQMAWLDLEADDPE